MKTPNRISTFSWSFGLLVFCVVLQGCASPPASAPRWTRDTWNEEPAWVSDSGEWRAIVSEHRARLIYLGPKDGTTNLLYAPVAPKEFRPRGGHLFWLGPQSEWNGRWGAWPPPEEWEQLPAHRAEVEGDSLRLALPRPDKTRPQLTRAYRWENGVLHCRAAWSGGAGDHQAMHLLQLPSHTIVETRLSTKTPPRFVRFDTKGKQESVPEALGESATLLPGGLVRMQSHVEPDKYGFPPGTLHARIDAYRLTLGRGTIEGPALESPDQGFDTQVYLGGSTWPFVELEHLSPRLKNWGETENVFTIWIKPRFISPVPPTRLGHRERSARQP
jgi:hypothetical protein